MVHIDNLYNSLNNYVEALESTGYYSKEGSMALLIYTFIVDAIFDGPLQDYLEDDDLAALNNLFNCLSKHNCVISRISSGQHLSKPRQYYNPAIFRILHDNRPRITNEDGFRRTERDRRQGLD